MIHQFHSPTEISQLAKQVFQLLRLKEWNLATAESATGGIISHFITNNDGSSDIFLGGVVCYSAELKQSLLKVPFSLIQEHGAVSEAVTMALLDGLHKQVNCDVAIAITGIAGAASIEGKASGLFYIGVHTPTQQLVKEYHFKGTRVENKYEAAYTAFSLLLSILDV